MSSIASLRRKDSMWIYKNPQGLQVLNDELNERRKKRSARTRYNTTAVLSPPLSPIEKLIPIVNISEIKNTTDLKRPPSPIEEKPLKEKQKLLDSLKPIDQWKQKSMEDKNIKKLSVITSTVQEKKNAIQLRTKQEDSNSKVQVLPNKVTFPPTKVATPPTTVATPPMPPTRTSSPPTPTVSTSKRATSPTSTPEKKFLLEARQKLFSTPQKTIKKNLPDTPIKKNRIVSSYISAFETPTNKQIKIPPTPLCPPETVTPVTSSVPDSYFSEVIDRRFSPTPTETEEEPIIVYLPQLSPDMSFCTNALDIPDDDTLFQTRPCIKKQVSFSEQISTFIPDDVNPITDFVRTTLSTELMDVSAGIQQTQQREKFIPAIKKKDVPQKLSNKLLDIFQKKPMDQPATRQLTHLTKTRPRKPPSLKKPTTLTYPAPIAQPDWRTRAITTNKSSVLI